jgi:hypothetical protein
MNAFIIALMEARTNQEVTEITWQFPELLADFPYLWKNVQDARKRINYQWRLRKQYFETVKPDKIASLQILETIYNN